MKIRLLNGLLLIDILTLFLILAIILVPSSAVRIMLGLPFMLFFQGYTLVVALFPISNKSDNADEEGEKAKEGMEGIERVALSFGTSIAITALIGLGLNYTPWGITLNPVMYSIGAFILVLSVVAVIRRNMLPGGFKTTKEFLIRMPIWKGSAFSKSLAIILVVFIIGGIGVLVYTVANPKIGERFTEFYVLGNNGRAENYPTSFVMAQGSVAQVSYDKGATLNTGTEGKVTLGIVNHEQQESTYGVVLQIDGQAVAISSNGTSSNRFEQIKLQQGEKWEQEVGFAPQHTGENQKVEFFLFKDGSATAEETLNLWVDVK